MRLGKATGVNVKLYSAIEKKIALLFYNEIYAPLIAELRAEGIENSIDPLLDALKTGKVYYGGGAFSGQFNSRITKRLRDIGAVFDRAAKVYKMPEAQLTPDLRVGITAAMARVDALQGRLLDNLASVDIQAASKQLLFDFGAVADKINDDLMGAIRPFTVAPIFTDEMKANITKEWGENLEIEIKGWADEHILKLRESITQNTFAGNRSRDLDKSIMKGYGVSQKKARFLARQETSLLYSKVREERYADAGINKYKWVTNMDGRERDMHADLNGNIYYFAEPPIVNEKGERLNPGEDFGCRCRARPVLD
jgi:SPP1 gp7 family putative phage head morphogenesis protein